MATKNELETRLSMIEENLMQNVRTIRNDLNVLTELLAKTRGDLDRTRADLERVRNVVDTMKNLQPDYNVKTDSSW
ncbi:MAG: hypothetical protein Q7K54_03100 [Candidatus Parcubacteria bacterium]|nr:hypothetical protein [Candidatus Parcubacteria bacterium]